MSPLPDDRLTLTDELVAELVFDQFPNLVGRELGRRYTLHDHVTVRIGDDYGAIFPTVPGKDHLYERVTGLLAPLLRTWSTPVSAPIATGKPGHGFPYHWTLVPWISGSTAAFVPLHEPSAARLGSALKEIHSPCSPDAPASPVTAVPLAELGEEWTRLLSEAVESGAPENRVLDSTRADAMWRAAADAPIDVPATWTHGNLEPRAVLSDRGTFAGLLIWHAFGAGDRAADLGYAANLLPFEMRQSLLRAYGPITATTALRVQGWQLIGALRLIELGDPFLVRLAWERLIEFDLVAEA